MNDKTAFIFPGQGSQQVGMLAALAAHESTVVETLTEASDVLGFDVKAMVFTGPAESLNTTENTQPILLACSIALWRLWLLHNGKRPDYVAGHSLGEYSALAAAGTLQFADALQLVRDRGRYMQKAVPEGEGSMIAVLGLDPSMVTALCAEIAAEGEVLEPANINAPTQVVVAGSVRAIKRAADRFVSAGARRVIPLPVSVPSHCALMKTAARNLCEDLQAASMTAPLIPVVQNVSAKAESHVDTIRNNLVRQLYSPVLWVESVRALIGYGVRQCMECGPGKILAGLGRQIDRTVPVTALDVESDTFLQCVNSQS